MPSQDDYLDSLLKNMENDPADTNNLGEDESSADDLEDVDTVIEDAVSDMGTASDEKSGPKFGEETLREPDAGFGEEMPFEPDTGPGTERPPELDAESGDERLPEFDAVSGEAQSSEHDADDLDDLDLDEIYSDIGFFLGEKGKKEAAPKAGSAEQDAVSDLDALNSMTEDEIERLLSAGAEEGSVPGDRETFPDDEELSNLSDDEELLNLSDDEELLNLLNDAEDDDLQDIHEMLQRAGNNEAVDESLLQRGSGNENESGGPPGGEDDLRNTLSEKEQRAQQKKLSKEERAAAKAAAKAEKAAAKAAAKAEKAAAKAAAKAEKAAAKTGTAAGGGAPEGSPDGNAAAKNEKKESSGTLFDTSLLDSIVAGAEQAGSEETAAREESGNVDSGEGVGEAAAAQDEIDSDESDFDMESLLEDDGNVDLSGQNNSKSSDSSASKTKRSSAEITEDEEPKPKKGGFFAKIMDFLTEENEEEEESESLKLSEENRDILDDLDNEKAGAKNKKKKKGASDAGKGGKGKAKKSKAKKKPKAPPKPKKAKKPKPEKPKKEKTPEPEPLIPEQKLTLKRVMPIVLVCISFGVFIIVFINSSVDFSDKQAAVEAYNTGDYQTCFQNLYGKNLNEEEQLMYGKSESILYIRLWLREYEMFAQDGDEVEALDSLIQTVNDYPKLYNYAVQWDAGAEVAAGYQTVLNILLEKYGLTEEQAKEIAAESSDRRYTRMIVEIVQGNGFGTRNEQAPAPELEQQTPAPEPEQDSLQDVLPEEEGLGEGEFIGN